MNNTSKKKFSVSAGLKATGLFTTAEKAASPLSKSLYRPFDDSSRGPQPAKDVVLTPGDLEGAKSPRSAISGLFRARFSWIRRARSNGDFNQQCVKDVKSIDQVMLDTTWRHPKGLADGGEVHWSKTMELVSPAGSHPHDESVSMLQTSLSEAQYSRGLQGETPSSLRVGTLPTTTSRTDTSAYATARGSFSTHLGIPSIEILLSRVAKSSRPATETPPEIVANISTPKQVNKLSGAPRGLGLLATDLRHSWRTARIREMTAARMEWHESETGTGHFMLFQLTFPPHSGHKDIWMRLERCSANSSLRSAATRPKSLVGQSPEDDVAILSSEKDTLVGGESETFSLKETIERPIPFAYILDMLDLAHKSSASGRTNDSWLFASFVKRAIYQFREPTGSCNSRSSVDVEHGIISKQDWMMIDWRGPLNT
ncbi:hypothetical protein FRC07_004088 [Ceratobasidium sp. 392]|nr:hypothetical protein FRC07_004088 [Ceratobasidium sp. 392]